jgi:hypothetical protein
MVGQVETNLAVFHLVEVISKKTFFFDDVVFAINFT